ncbi:MAG: type I 3-dehydroquinate dehydratase [Nitrososphaeria archaeon]|nr:type I 3-dehydroquinate dehydratase [Nitrososphaeria archaeon]
MDEKCLDKANMSDLIEVRIDIIGESWTSIASRLKRPWIACNRRKEEGGMWYNDEERRVMELLKALQFGAEYVDIELLSPNINRVVEEVKSKGKKVIVSYHDFKGTPSYCELKKILKREIEVGADVCKIVTFAKKFEDNITILKFIRQESSLAQLVSFCMGEMGIVSRILSPFFGSKFTYASIDEGLESAAGQVGIENLREFYKIFQETLKS